MLCFALLEHYELTHTCAAYKRTGSDMMIAFPDDKESARKDIFQRIRFYACPFFVYRSEQASKKRGFLFLQSDSTLAEMSLPIPVLANGRPVTKLRGVLMHFLTMEEYSNELCKDDFEMVIVKKELQNAVNEYEESKELALMMKFRCGHMAVGITKLMPDHTLCSTLGKEYYEQAGSAVQLNIDDVWDTMEWIGDMDAEIDDSANLVALQQGRDSRLRCSLCSKREKVDCI